MSPFEAIRAACRQVAERARYVRLVPEALFAYAEALPLEAICHPRYDAEHHFLGDAEATAAFWLTLDAINFGSGYFPALRKRPGMSGYFTIASALSAHFYAHGPLSAAQLAELDTSSCAALLQQDLALPLRAELMALYSAALRALGRYLMARFGGRFSALIEAADASAAKLVALLAEMPYFNDVADYAGIRVPFYKRAQITASDLALAFGGQGLGRFDDLAQLTIFADNLVPHVLRLDGVLTYAPELAARIDAGETLAAGSAEEVEIRAVALHAAELLVGALQARGAAVSARELDIYLWNRGQAPRYRTRPRHRTRTVFY